MHKIYKYNVVDGHVELPIGATVIRQDHVDDGFYKGDFVWAIVDTEQKALFKLKYEKDSPCQKRGGWFQIRVKEKQVINSGTPLQAYDIDGAIGITVDTDQPQNHIIAVYKTGQEIDLPIENLVYLGLNKLWIMQELGLYTFLVKK